MYESDLTLSRYCTRNSMHMGGCAVMCMDSVEGVDVDACFHVVIIISGVHDATQCRKVDAISVYTSMCLLISICCCRTSPPYVTRDEASWEVECSECKFIAFDFVFEPSYEILVLPLLILKFMGYTFGLPPPGANDAQCCLEIMCLKR